MTCLGVGLACAVALLGCGAGSSGEGGGGGNTAIAGAGGAGVGGGGGAGCACDAGTDAYASEACFCSEVGSACQSAHTIDEVLAQACPGPLIHPISASCKIGGLFFPADNETVFTSFKSLFDRDTGELVGRYASADVTEYCEGSSFTARWGEVAASCELCDPCGDSPDYPPCPEPEM